MEKHENASSDRARRCDGVSRRDVLQVGGLAAFGLGIGQLQAAVGGRDSSRSPRAKSCILIWLDGGPSHLETFDLKPSAPLEVRGPLKPIQTAIPGVVLSECLPRLAQRMKQVALVRSMTSPLGEHNFGTHYLMTGHRPSPVLEYPVHGSVAAYLQQSREMILPAHIAVPDFRVGGSKISGHGFLPPAIRPFAVGSDPAKPGFRVRDLDFYAGITADRMRRRQSYLQDLDRFSGLVEDRGESSNDPEFEQAYRLITSSQAKQAFDLAQEPRRVRERYGSRTVGQSCLLARRLVERGVSFVTVNHHGWDTHNNLYTRLKEGYTGAKKPVGLIPSLDMAVSALLDDLTERGLLDETLVVVMGEFGRTPKLNTAGGRDHWPRVFSLALAGAGIRGGTIVGSSDAVGESPRDRPVTPAELAATIYTLLGIAPGHELRTTDSRPVRLVAEGNEPIAEVMAS